MVHNKFENILIRNLLFSVIAFLLSPIVTTTLMLSAVQNQAVLGSMDTSEGVFAVNIEKSSYETGEEITLAYSVLDIMGTMVCDAKIITKVIDANGTILAEISTNNKKINAQPACETKRNLHDLTPDYLGTLKMDKQGTYKLVSTATTIEKKYTSEKYLVIDNDPNFVVTRKATTRVFPRDPYKVILEIKANKDFEGEVIEKIPLEFQVFNSKMFKTTKTDKYITITWNVTWQKGETYELFYKYKAPEISPDYYQLGNLEIFEHKVLDILSAFTSNGKNPIFNEKNSWDLAIDDLLNHYSVTCVTTPPKDYTNPSNAQGEPTLASNAPIGSFTTSNSAVGITSDGADLNCDAFVGRDLGSFSSAKIVFSAAVSGKNGGDDYLDVNYTVGATAYDLTTIPQNTNQGYSNATNGGYWSYSAPNITSWSDINQTTIEFIGVKIGGPDKSSAYIDAVWIEADYTPRTFTQNDFEWFVTADSVTLSNAWPSGNGDNLLENEVFTQFPASNEAMKPGDKIRLQMNVTVGAANLPTTIESFKLEYVAADNCVSASGWTSVGAKGSGTIWRLFDEASIGDSTTQINNISTSSSGAEGYYSEINASANNPNAVNTTQNTEWDWPLENNGAADNTSYCFRIAVYDETPAFSYNSDSYPRLITAPGAVSLMRHGNTFRLDNEQGYFWAN